MCPLCGGKLAKTALRASWGIEYRALTDWFAWNAYLRIGLPVILVVGLMVLVNEIVFGGSIGLQILFQTWFFPLMGSLLMAHCMGIVLVLAIRKTEFLYYVLDQKGVHVQIYKLKKNAEQQWLLSTEKHLLWAQLRRIHPLPERSAVLLYAPAWWHALTLYCNNESYANSLEYMKKRTGKSKEIRWISSTDAFNDIT